MGDIVSFSKFRKQKARDAAREQAEVNRMLHGRSKAEKTAEETTKSKAERDLDGKKRDSDEPTDSA